MIQQTSGWLGLITEMLVGLNICLLNLHLSVITIMGTGNGSSEGKAKELTGEAKELRGTFSLEI